MNQDFKALPDDLPVPEDDGAADHLTGSPVPAIRLATAGGQEIDLEQAGKGLAVIFIYPQTGTPGVESPDGWDQIPGARGCTPQSCAYRDRIDDFRELGAEVFGLSSQPLTEQSEFKEREDIPYELINDSALSLKRELDLPTFEAGGLTLYRRLTMVLSSGAIEKTFYPVFPPDRNATDVIAWLREVRP